MCVYISVYMFMHEEDNVDNRTRVCAYILCITGMSLGFIIIGYISLYIFYISNKLCMCELYKFTLIPDIFQKTKGLISHMHLRGS